MPPIKGKSLFTKKLLPSGPSWMTTFADLMTLLLCFFVLLLSFSEMDKQKFKILSGSLKDAFGVQRIKPVFDLPKGMDIIANDFNEPIFVDEFLLEKIKSAVLLSHEKGNLKVEEDEVSVRLILPEQMLFESGSAQLKPDAKPILERLLVAIGKTPHRVMVVGHTDNVPIRSLRFPSNWELSAARACSVIRYLIENGGLDPTRFTAVGKADTEPIAPNDSAQNRTKNRRVELIFEKNLKVKKRGKPGPLLWADAVRESESKPIKGPHRWPW
jgi:chemotaxis protein MotB